MPNWHVPTARSRRDLERYRTREEAALQAWEMEIVEKCRLEGEAKRAKEAEVEAAEARAAESKAIKARAAEARVAASKIMHDDLVPKTAQAKKALDDFAL